MRNITNRVSATTSSILILLFVIGTIAPMATSEANSQGEIGKLREGLTSEERDSGEGNAQYLFVEGENPVFSASSKLKKKWIEEGFPNLVLPFEPQYQQTKNSVRSCENAWSAEDTDNITTSEGTVTATVDRISSNSAIFVVINSTACHKKR